MTDLSITRGDDRDYDITVTDAAAAPVNLTGCTLRFTARFPGSAFAFIAKSSSSSTQIEITNAAGGLAVLKLDPADTTKLPRAVSTLEYDLELTQGAGTVTTLAQGDFTVHSDVGP